jgi:Flp pilus assembly protein TadG
LWLEDEMTAFRWRGQSLVEFTLIMLVLLILLGGLIDVGRALALYVRLNDAAEEGAAYASVHPQDMDGIAARALAQAESSTATVQVDFYSAPCAGHGVEVRIADELPLVFPFTRLFWPSDTVHLEAQATHTVLRPLCASAP